MSPLQKRAGKAILYLFLFQALLVGTHLGEFWPFSIYPMFSRGGHPWSRAVVRELPKDYAIQWNSVLLENLPGETFPLAPQNINQNDIANFVSKSTTWDEQRIHGMRKIFGDALDARNLMIFRADGTLDEKGEVNILFVPFLVLTPDTTLFNPTQLTSNS